MLGDLKYIPPGDLVAFDDYVDTHPIAVDVVYAQPDHSDNIFKQAIYRPSAKMWGHKDMVNITLEAAKLCFKEHGWILEIKDCLRPIEAQAAMAETPIVKANPQWAEEPRLLSPPGKGGHPRGMAVDIIPLTENGDPIDMGTAFDYLTEDRENNPAARHYMHFFDDAHKNQAILNNRDQLTKAMVKAADAANMELLPLPQEWWDFRFMPRYTNLFTPISDADLPENMQIMLE